MKENVDDVTVTWQNYVYAQIDKKNFHSIRRRITFEIKLFILGVILVFHKVICCITFLLRNQNVLTYIMSCSYFVNDRINLIPPFCHENVTFISLNSYLPPSSNIIRLLPTI